MLMGGGSMLRRKALDMEWAKSYYDGGVHASDWWDEIDESEQWQKGIYYSLCGSYALISFIALVCQYLLPTLFFRFITKSGWFGFSSNRLSLCFVGVRVCLLSFALSCRLQVSLILKKI